MFAILWSLGNSVYAFNNFNVWVNRSSHPCSFSRTKIPKKSRSRPPFFLILKKKGVVRNYSSSREPTNSLNPYFVTGFSDAFPKKANKALVVWGTNLISTVGVRFTTKQLGMVQLAPYQFSVIVGLILSDGWLTFASKTNKNARVGFKQSVDSGAYVLFVFNLLSHYCSSYPKLTTSIRYAKSLRDKEGLIRATPRSGKQLYGLQFFTRSMPCITDLYFLFYPNGVKIVPHNIYELLTPIALAHVVMGDGSAQRNGLVICTNSYSVQDVIRFMNVLIIRYRLECTIHIKKQNQKIEYMIYIRQNSMALLLNIVSPYMHHSMFYRIKSCLNIPRDKHEIEVLDVKNNITTAYNSINEAAKILNIPHSTIVNYFNRNQVKPYKSIYVFNKRQKLENFNRCTSFERSFINFRRFFSNSTVQNNRSSTLEEGYFIILPLFFGFSVSIAKSTKQGIGWRIMCRFDITLPLGPGPGTGPRAWTWAEGHKKDLDLLNSIKDFGTGKVYLNTNNSCIYTVQSIKDLAIIINHFNNYRAAWWDSLSLLRRRKSHQVNYTKISPTVACILKNKNKSSMIYFYFLLDLGCFAGDFILFKLVYDIVKCKDHLTKEGLNKILSHKASINRGLTSELKFNFPDIIPTSRPLVINQEIKDPNWLSGFVAGEGCFLVDIMNSKSNAVGKQVVLKFQVTQSVRDINLLKSFNSYLVGGKYYQGANRDRGDFRVQKFSDIFSIIIPFFKNYPLHGVKAKDFADFCRVADIIHKKNHLTASGIDEIIRTKSLMNRGRDLVINKDDKEIVSFLSLDEDTVPTFSAPNISIRNTLKGRRSYTQRRGFSYSQVRRYYCSRGYLAGLIEGKGEIVVHDPNSKAKVYSPKFIIALPIQDELLAKKLSVELKADKVVSKRGAGHILLQISAKQEVLRIITLINGKMRTPKIEALHKAIHWLNEGDNNLIPCLDLDFSPLGSNSWLAGFTDGEGSFEVTLFDRKKKGMLLRTSVQTSFRIEVKANYSIQNVAIKAGYNKGGFSYFQVLSEIACFFNVNLYVRTSKTQDRVYYKFVLLAHNSINKELVRNYFDCYPLYSSKYLTYRNWCMVEDILKVPLDKENMNKIQNINSNFQSKNKVFYLSHLNSLTF